jgi:hypothetical protein
VADGADDLAAIKALLGSSSSASTDVSPRPILIASIIIILCVDPLRCRLPSWRSFPTEMNSVEHSRPGQVALSSSPSPRVSQAASCPAVYILAAEPTSLTNSTYSFLTAIG